ncbi:MAG: hypothetical protein IJX53_00605 [Clostridia bacterium]|nr:hypothetical protein [Clostridia bacterium]
MKKLLITLVLIAMTLTFTGCVRPYDTPEFVTIEPSQTAFLIPLVGDTEQQASFESEELLANAKVAMKEVQIPHRWVQTGRWDWVGEWRPTAKLVIVERKPETREWCSTDGVGTSAQNQAIYAESAESIGFSVGMNCSAQIDSEKDAVRFLYSYNNKTLADIMDSEIRARVESNFVEQCAKRTLNEILVEKEEIMAAVRADVEAYFSAKGITITVLGMKDGLEYDDPQIQTSINEKFSSEQKLVTQENENKRILSEAQAIAEANRILSESITDDVLRQQYIEKWNGVLPQYVGGEASVMVGLE